MLKSEEIRIRDPFILTDTKNGFYYMYGTTYIDANSQDKGFDCYRSRNLEQWEGPFAAFRPEHDFWADLNFWAPEVYLYHEAYYMLASFKSHDPMVARGTQVLKAEYPEGPFLPVSSRPVTPSCWECLDGTLFVDENNKPWMIFCHEWTQINDGEICAMRMSEDLTTVAGEPVFLFKASQAPWSKGKHSIPPHIYSGWDRSRLNYVTDGPFIYRTKDGTLLVLWSSFGEKEYAIGIAVSESGLITGPWRQVDEPMWNQNGGHSMIFKSFEGELMLTFHMPNAPAGMERPHFFHLEDCGNILKIRECVRSQNESVLV